MDHICWLSDVYGPRLTGGPGIMQASEWAMKKFSEWGLANGHREPFAFGKGWTLERFSAHLIEPQIEPLIGFPGAWTPGTNGPVTADVILAQIATEADFQKFRGKLKDKIVLTQPERAVRMLEGPFVLRMTEPEFAEAATVPAPAAGGARPRSRGAGCAAAARAAASRQLRAEAAAVLQGRRRRRALQSWRRLATWRPAAATSRGSSSVRTAARSSRPAAARATPTPAPACRRSRSPSSTTTGWSACSRRIPGQGRAQHPDASSTTRRRRTASTSIAEMPGSDPGLKDEIVLLGAHFDSVAAGTGATDNATGSAAMMEALRILKTVGAKPRRTIRIGLWGGEEQGLLGSRAYVEQHFGDVATMDAASRSTRTSRSYFNSDNGTGRVRGIWLQSNLGGEPIFAQWIEPLADLGVTALGPRSVASTDHSSFDAVGLPGVPVHGRSPGVQLAHAPLEHGHLRPGAARRHGPAGDGRRDVRLQRRDAGREAAAQAAEVGSHFTKICPCTIQRPPVVRTSSHIVERPGGAWNSKS